MHYYMIGEINKIYSNMDIHSTELSWEEWFNHWYCLRSWG